MVKEGSVTRVMNVYDHFLALLGVAVLRERSTPECPEQSSFVHPSTPSANQMRLLLPIM